MSVVENWPQVTSKRLSPDLLEVAQGACKFSQLERLLPAPNQEEEDQEEEDDHALEVKALEQARAT